MNFFEICQHRIEYVALIFLTVFSFSVIPQSGWYWQNPWPTGNHLYDVWVLNDTTIIVDGLGGLILRSHDNGESWRELKIDDYEFIVGLMFIDNQTGLAIGNGKNAKSLLKTNDSGQNWSNYIIPTNVDLYDLFFVNNNTGWVVGEVGKIYKTSDSGLSWQEQSLPVGWNLFSVFFLDSLNGWAVGEAGLIAKTNNGGDSWDYYYLNNYEDLISIVFTSQDSGWITGANSNWQGTILATTDNGMSWTTQFTTPNVDPILYIFALDNQRLWACSNNGNFLRTENSGLTWTITPSDTNFGLNSIYFTNDSIGYCVGFNGRIFSTQTGGDYWVKISRSATYEELEALKMVNDNIGWAVGTGGTVLKTTDGGRNWIPQSLLQSELSGNINALINFNSIALSDEMNLWVAGNIQDSTFNTQGLIISSQNGGQTWESVLFPDNDGFLDIDFVNDSVGWALAWKYYDRILYKTTNGGQNWTVVWADTTNSTANKIEFINENTGWISSLTLDTLLKTVNGGTNWSPQVIGFPYGIGDIYFSDVQQGWVVGGYEIFGGYPIGGEGYIFNTTDGGNTWILQKHIMKDMFIGIDIFDNSYGSAIGYNGTIYHTEDGGINWDDQQTSMIWTIKDVDFVNAEKGWICGSAGAILYTNTGGITSIHNPPFVYSLPENIILFQNYPNPFNHTTTIEFSIRQRGEVKVGIFNILGEHVKTLLTKYLIPGTYKINWNGSDTSGKTVSSGVYLFRVENVISTGKISKTKKMIFIK